jgi:ribonuclease D
MLGGETRTDWRRRPLTEAQLRYALDDVRYLLDLAGVIAIRLDDLGRAAWVDAELIAFAEAIRSRSDDQRWRRLPGLHSLGRRGLEIARRLADWRQAEARRSNRPLRQLLRDDLLVAIAKRQPSHRHELEALRDFSRPQLQAKGAEILAVIAEAQTVPTEALPEPPERHDEGPGMTMIVNVLAAALARCCAEHKVATGLVGSSSDLKDLIRWHAQGCPASRIPALALGWRHAVCGRTLLDILDGRLALRITDTLAEIPVRLIRLEDQPARPES